MRLPVADAATPTELEPNAVECIECPSGNGYASRVYTEEEHDLAADGYESCPEDADHAVTPIHVADDPVGVGNDEDYYAPGTRRYEYPLEL